METGEKLVVVTEDELTAFTRTANALNGLTWNFTPTLAISDPPAPAGMPLTAVTPEKVRRGKNKKTPVKSQAGERLCAWCDKPLPKNGHPRMKTHEGKCKKMYAREYAKMRQRDKRDKQDKPALAPAVNPSDPGLSDEERQKLKTDREALLKKNKRKDRRKK
jgi:hypothetical protein